MFPSGTNPPAVSHFLDMVPSGTDIDSIPKERLEEGLNKKMLLTRRQRSRRRSAYSKAAKRLPPLRNCDVVESVSGNSQVEGELRIESEDAGMLIQTQGTEDAGMLIQSLEESDHSEGPHGLIDSSSDDMKVDDDPMVDASLTDDDDSDEEISMHDLAYNDHRRLGAFNNAFDYIMIGDAQWPSAIALTNIDYFTDGIYSHVLGCHLQQTDYHRTAP